MRVVINAVKLKGTPTAIPIPLNEVPTLLDANTVVKNTETDVIFEAINFALLYFLLTRL